MKMNNVNATARAWLLSACLVVACWSAFGQAEQSVFAQGPDGDQSVKTSQEDNEDHETTLDWVGLFGLLGLVGIVGPDGRAARRLPVAKRTLVIGLVVAVGVSVWAVQPVIAGQDQPQDNPTNSIASTQEDDEDGRFTPSMGWFGLLGLAGLLGLRGRKTKRVADS